MDLLIFSLIQFFVSAYIYTIIAVILGTNDKLTSLFEFIQNEISGLKFIEAECTSISGCGSPSTSVLQVLASSQDFE